VPDSYNWAKNLAACCVAVQGCDARMSNRNPTAGTKKKLGIRLQTTEISALSIAMGILSFVLA